MQSPRKGASSCAGDAEAEELRRSLGQERADQQPRGQRSSDLRVGSDIAQRTAAVGLHAAGVGDERCESVAGQRRRRNQTREDRNDRSNC